MVPPTGTVKRDPRIAKTLGSESTNRNERGVLETLTAIGLSGLATPGWPAQLNVPQNVNGEGMEPVVGSVRQRRGWRTQGTETLHSFTLFGSGTTKRGLAPRAGYGIPTLPTYRCATNNFRRERTLRRPHSIRSRVGRSRTNERRDRIWGQAFEDLRKAYERILGQQEELEACRQEELKRNLRIKFRRSLYTQSL